MLYLFMSYVVIKEGLMREELLTAPELAAYLKVELRTVYRYLKAGYLPAIRMGGRWRFRKEEIDQWLLQRVQPEHLKRDQPRILVIDDDAKVRSVFIDCLQALGHNAQGADDGETALALLRDTAFDLLLVDLKMPGMGGMEFIRRIRSSQPRARVIILTGNGSKETAIEALNLRVSAYLEKPIRSLAVLESAVAQALKP